MTDSPIPLHPSRDPLDFTPVPRKVKRPDGWDPERQRRFIALLAETGSPHRAAEALGKRLSGVEALYRDAAGASFRAAWDKALEIAAKRESNAQAGFATHPRFDPPHRRRSPGPDSGYGGGGFAAGGFGAGGGGEGEDDGDGENSTWVMIERLIAKFQRKVGQERHARRTGDVVAADFYLRQITALEVAFDLMVEGHEDAGWRMLAETRRGGRNMLHIADTRMARTLDDARRQQWAAMGEPERPPPWPDRYCLSMPGGDVRIETDEQLGKASRAPAGADPDAWAAMDMAEQQRIYAEQHAANAKAQVEWERRAQEAWEASEHGAVEPERAKPGVRRGGHPKRKDAQRKPRLRLAAPPPPPADDPYAEYDALDENGEDFADRAMREAIAAAREAFPEDWE